ncbi:MAG TPA: hypothetical protein VME47_21810 [Acetobacteraceae bacterium]|nr:hypothetical protein [Acetobacteraceae bacterium]
MDSWTLTVLGLSLIVLARPAVASLLQRSSARAVQRKYNPERAGGGAAMLAAAGYLISGHGKSVEWGFWDLASQAVHDPFVRSLPNVWVPTLCWAVLLLFGFVWLYSGIRGYRGPRKPMTIVWALNEIILCSALLLSSAYAPEDSAQAAFINFGLEGIYLSFLIGAVLRFFLVLLNPGGPPQSFDPRPGGPMTAWLGRIRRY